MSAKKGSKSRVYASMLCRSYEELDEWERRKARAWARTIAAEPTDFVYTAFSLEEAGHWTNSTKQNVSQNSIPAMASANVLVRIAKGARCHPSLYVVNRDALSFFNQFAHIRNGETNA